MNKSNLFNLILHLPSLKHADLTFNKSPNAVLK